MVRLCHPVYNCRSRLSAWTHLFIFCFWDVSEGLLKCISIAFELHWHHRVLIQLISYFWEAEARLILVQAVVSDLKANST